MDPTTIVLLIVALAASLFAAWTIGAGSTGATPFAPAVGANAISIMQATFVVGVLGFAGAVLQGAAITETVGDGLIGEVSLSPLAATIALTIAAIYIAAGVFKGYPIATAFAITGSVVGVGLAMGGEPVWGTYAEIGAYWILTPFFVAPVAYATTRLLRSERVPEIAVVPILAGIIGAIIANIDFIVLGPPGEPSTLAAETARVLPLPEVASMGLATAALAGVLAAVLWRETRIDPVRAERRFLLGLGALVAFTAGGGKVGLAVGPLLPLTEAVVEADMMIPVLVLGGIGILAGSWMAATRMVKALSQDYADLGPRRSIGVLVPSFAIAQFGILFGLPMSFNEIFISAIIGTGLAVGSAGVSGRKVGFTVLAWIGSLVFSLVVGYGAYALLSTVTGIT